MRTGLLRLWKIRERRRHLSSKRKKARSIGGLLIEVSPITASCSSYAAAPLSMLPCC